MTISEITTAVQPLEVISKLNETIPIVNASVPDATLSVTSTNSIQNKAVAQALNIKQDSATAVTHTATTAVGDTTTPVYIASDGTATALTYSIAKSVPSDAVFTDTTYSQGSGITISDNTISNSGVRSISQGSGNGAISVNTGGSSADVTVKGLGTSAFQDVSSSYSATGTTVINGTAVASAISGKQDIINDLSDIRSGASAGATALQPSDVTSSYSASGTAPVNGTAVASALTNINIDVDQTYNASSTIAQSGTAVAEALATINIPLVDQTYSASSTNAQSGTAVASAISGILPDQTGNEGKFLATNGTTTSWETVQGGSSTLFFTVTNPTLTPSSGICTWTITHNLGTQNIFVAVYDDDNTELFKNVTIVSDNVVNVTFNSDVTIVSGSYRAVISAGGGGSYSLPTATTSTLGGVKIDGTSITINNDGVISSTGGPFITVDSTLSSTSTNPVQNKVLYPSLSGYLPDGTTITVKTDGTGDFTSLADAISYLTNKWSDGSVTISIGAGTYSVSSAVNINGNKFNIPYLNISGNAVSDTIFNFSNSSSTGLIQASNINGCITLQKITINGAGSSVAGSRGINVISTHGAVYIQNVNVSNVNAGICIATLGRAWVSGCTISNCASGMWCGNASIAFCMNDTFSNCSGGMSLYKGAQIFLEGTGTFTNVTTPYSQTINTLTSNGIIYGSW